MTWSLLIMEEKTSLLGLVVKATIGDRAGASASDNSSGHKGLRTVADLGTTMF